MIKKTRDLSREANILYELNHPSIFYHKNHNQKIFNDLKIYTIYIKLEMKMHYNKKKKKANSENHAIMQTSAVSAPLPNVLALLLTLVLTL